MSIRDTFQRGTDAFNAHDREGLAATMAEGVSVRAPGVGELKGKPAVTAFYMGWLDAFPDGRVDVEAVHVLEDVVVEEGTFNGTHRATLHGPGGDLPATGRAVCVGYVQVLRFRGDQVASFHLAFDRAEMMEQLGVAPFAPAEEAAYRRGEAAPQPMQPH